MKRLHIFAFFVAVMLSFSMIYAQEAYSSDNKCQEEIARQTKSNIEALSQANNAIFNIHIPDSSKLQQCFDLVSMIEKNIASLETMMRRIIKGINDVDVSDVLLDAANQIKDYLLSEACTVVYEQYNNAVNQVNAKVTGGADTLLGSVGRYSNVDWNTGTINVDLGGVGDYGRSAARSLGQ